MKKTAVIDGDSLLYFAMGHDIITDAVADLVGRIRSICTETGATHFVLYLTPEHTFRHDVARTKGYKANRKPEDVKPPMFFALKHYAMVTLGAVMVDNLEADDMVALHMAKLMESKEEDAVLAAIDKDVLGQVPGRHWDYKKVEWINTSEDDAAKFLWVQALMGDNGDNIQGIPRMGVKGAEKILAEGDYAAATLNAYIEKFGPILGVAMFTEMFTLVAILRDETVAAYYAKVEYADPTEVTALPVIASKAEESGFHDLTTEGVDPVIAVTAAELDEL